MNKELSPSPSAVTKGWGLKKWRRIRRESGKETNSNLDSNRKRGMAALPAGFKPKSAGSNSSTNAVSNIVSNALDRIGIYGDFSSGKGPDFGSRADSDNSEDQNSRSSTAASAPRTNHNFPVINSGFDKNTVTNSVQKDQQEKSRNVTKKARGVRIKKENSISSMESDSRSSDFVFVQGSNSMTSNGMSGKLGNYDEDDSDDGQNGDKRLNDEDRIELSKNEADSADVLHEEKVDDHVESIMPLHLAQEALEREVQKLRDVGKDNTLSLIDEEFQSNKNNEINLQNKLEEAFITLELKNTKISQLESALNLKEIKTEHEELMTQRIAAELEYLVISQTIQNLKAGPIDQIHVLQQKKMQFDDTWKLKNMMRKYAYCGIIQLVLFLVVLYMFVLKFSSKNVEVIPT